MALQARMQAPAFKAQRPSLVRARVSRASTVTVKAVGDYQVRFGRFWYALRVVRAPCPAGPSASAALSNLPACMSFLAYRLRPAFCG